MIMSELKRIAAAALALGVLTTGAAVLAQSGGDRGQVIAGEDRKDDAGVPAREFDALARRAWTITDLILENHMKPGTRPEMILSATRALLKAAKADEPADLARRVAGLKTPEELAELLRQVWPEAGAGKVATSEARESALLDGLFAAVPGESHLMPASEIKAHDQLGGNRYVGVGVQLGVDEKTKLPRIITPFRKGPSRRAGARPGDLIVEVDGRSTSGVGLAKVVEWLRGEEGTAVSLVVRRPDGDERRTLAVTRGVVPIDSVLGYRRAGEDDWTFRVDPSAPIGYVWVKAIRSSTPHELRQIERRLRAEGVRALVLDFRFSSGEGFLHQAELLADALLDGGVMWRLRDGQGEVRESVADRECFFRGWPMAVLVNGITDKAQGAILAAMQDHGRAELVGEPTKVDGYVNRLFELPDGKGSVVVRTSLLERTAEGRGWPVTPDEVVTLDEPQTKALRIWLFDKELPELPAGTDDRPPEDPQLARALELLKAALATGGRAEAP
jgi:carboxyl-terminal processing protease